MKVTLSRKTLKQLMARAHACAECGRYATKTAKYIGHLPSYRRPLDRVLCERHAACVSNRWEINGLYPEPFYQEALDAIHAPSPAPARERRFAHKQSAVEYVARLHRAGMRGRLVTVTRYRVRRDGGTK